MGGSYADHVNKMPSFKALLLGCSPLHLRLRTMESLINMGVKLALGGGFVVYGKKGLDRKKQKAMRQTIKDQLLQLDHLMLIDRAQHGRVGNTSTARTVLLTLMRHMLIASGNDSAVHVLKWNHNDSDEKVLLI